MGVLKRLASLLSCCRLWILCFPVLLSPLSGDKPAVAVSILPYQGLVERLAGDLVEVVVLVPPGAAPETFNPTPSEVRRLGQARLFFRVGVPFETRLAERLSEGAAELEVVDLRSRIRLRTIEEHHHHGEDHHHHGEDHHHDHEELFRGVENPDPHHWLSPRRLVSQVEQIAEYLIGLLPDQADGIRRAARELIQELDDLDDQVFDWLEPHEGRAFLVAHPAFGYFADDYRLRQKAIEVDGRDPSPRQLRELVLSAREEGIQVVFVQPGFDEAAARRVAGAIGGVVMVLDPLYPDVLANIRAIAESLNQVWSRDDE